MTLTITQDITKFDRSRKKTVTVLRKGDKVTLISDSDTVLIVEDKTGERHAISKDQAEKG